LGPPPVLGVPPEPPVVVVLCDVVDAVVLVGELVDVVVLLAVSSSPHAIQTDKLIKHPAAKNFK
jgi:hypothetical protein